MSPFKVKTWSISDLIFPRHPLAITSSASQQNFMVIGPKASSSCIVLPLHPWEEDKSQGEIRTQHSGWESGSWFSAVVISVSPCPLSPLSVRYVVLFSVPMTGSGLVTEKHLGSLPGHHTRTPLCGLMDKVFHLSLINSIRAWLAF